MADGLNRLLHIYDAESYSIRSTAWFRRHRDLLSSLEIYPVPVEDGRRGLRDALDNLVANGETFSRALFETHGSTGAIYFDDEAVDSGNLKSFFANRAYEKIFPYFHSRIYFNGCNVADDPSGWDFLDTAGSIFLKMFGGVTFAQTKPGYVLPAWSSLTGHVAHLFADTCYSVILPGGRVSGHVKE